MMNRYILAICTRYLVEYGGRKVKSKSIEKAAITETGVQKKAKMDLF